MMTRREIREAYQKNYREILAVILEMGGEVNIIYHKKDNTPLYKKLCTLQRTEHWLNKMEEPASSG
jgi:hypothetical protein